MAIFSKRKNKKDDPLAQGRASAYGGSKNQATAGGTRTRDLLTGFRRTPDACEAIKLLTQKHPDGSQAYFSYLRLANQGHTMEFYDESGDKNVEIEKLWRDFAARVGANSNDGIDGLLNQFHGNALRYGAQMCEVVIKDDLSDVEDVYPILPQSVKWELEIRDGKQRWIPYQQTVSKKVDLSKANFINIPLDPDTDSPTGSLIFESALMAVDQQMQMNEDLAAVVRRQAYPRRHVKLLTERLMKSAPADKRNGEPFRKYVNEIAAGFASRLQTLQPTQDFVTTDECEIDGGNGGDPSRSVDIRALSDMTDIATMNGFKIMSLLANRKAGITETFGTLQFKIMVLVIEGIQRGSKRLVENIARIWLRVHGLQATPKFTHNPIEWQTEKEKLEVAKMREDNARQAQAMGWIGPDSAAKMAVDAANAFEQSPPGGYKPISGT